MSLCKPSFFMATHKFNFTRVFFKISTLAYLHELLNYLPNIFITAFRALVFVECLSLE